MADTTARIGRPWRTGRKLGVTVYAQLGDEASDDDVLLLLVDSAAGSTIAEHIVDVHNRSLAE